MPENEKKRTVDKYLGVEKNGQVSAILTAAQTIQWT